MVCCNTLKQVAPTLLALAKISSSVLTNNKPRSLPDDFNEISRSFPIDIIFEGTRYIPRDSNGFVFVLSHVTSTLQFPCWLDTHAHPMGHIKGLFDALRLIKREKDFRIVAKDDAQSPLYFLKRKLIESYKGFPVCDGNGMTLKNAVRALKENAVIMITPEGESSTKLLPFHPGVKIFALADRPFIPCAYFEVRENNVSHFILRFGSQIDPETVRKNGVDELGFAVAALLPEEKRGYYSQRLPASASATSATAAR